MSDYNSLPTLYSSKKSAVLCKILSYSPRKIHVDRLRKNNSLFWSFESSTGSLDQKKVIPSEWRCYLTQGRRIYKGRRFHHCWSDASADWTLVRLLLYF